MARRAKQWGGARKGAGRKPRADVAATRMMKLSFTPGEYAQVRACCPPELDLGTWLRQLVMERSKRLSPKTRA